MNGAHMQRPPQMAPPGRPGKTISILLLSFTWHITRLSRYATSNAGYDATSRDDGATVQSKCTLSRPTT